MILNNQLASWIGVFAGAALALGTAACSSDDDNNGGMNGTGGDGSGAAGGTSSGGTSSGGTSSGGGMATGGTGNGTGGGAGMGGSDGTSDNARIRVMHLSPDAPAVDVFVNDADDATVSDLEFPEGTAYVEVPADTYDFDVAPAGMSADDTVLPIDGLELAAGMSYTAVAYDELASISALPLVDDYEGLGDDEIRVRAIHVAPGVGQVDIWNIPSSGDPAPLWTDVDFGVAGDAMDLPAGAYTVGFDVDDDATPDLTFALPDLPAGTVANVYAVNNTDGDVFLIAHLPDGSTARINPN